MILDAQALFSDAQALTSAAASTNLIDMSEARDIGTGRELYVVLVVDVALTDAGSNSTITVDFQTDSVEAFSSPTTAQTLFTVAATAAVGTVYYARLAPGSIDERYGRLYYTMNNGDLTTGTVTAGIVTDIQRYVSYPDNVTITS